VKLLTCNGDEFSVRDVGPVLLRLRRAPGGVPIKRYGFEITDDDTARGIVRKLIDTELYLYEREPR